MINVQDTGSEVNDNNLNIFDRRYFTMNKILEKVNSDKFKKIQMVQKIKILPAIKFKLSKKKEDNKIEEMKP